MNLPADSQVVGTEGTAPQGEMGSKRGMRALACSSVCSPEPALALLCASVSHLYKGRLDGGSLRATHWTTAQSHLENVTGFLSPDTARAAPAEAWPQPTSPLPGPGQLQEAFAPGMGTGSGHTQRHRWDCLSSSGPTSVWATGSTGVRQARVQVPAPLPCSTCGSLGCC